MNLLTRLILTIVFGAILGLETEARLMGRGKEKKFDELEQRNIGGLRTYAVLALFGGVAGIFFNLGFVILTYLLLSSVIVFTVVAYISDIKLRQAFGITTELAVILTFIIGFLTTSQIIELDIIVVILVLLTFFLARKGRFKVLLDKIQHRELIDIFSFGLVALVILPLLPNQDYTLCQFMDFVGLSKIESFADSAYGSIVLLNPFKMWLIVVLISGIELVGYLFSKIIGKKRGLLLTGVLGGIISSTSSTISFATKEKALKGKDKSSLYAGAALLANGFSFISGLVLLGALANVELLKKAFPIFGSMLIAGIILGLLYIFISRKNKEAIKLDVDYRPFSIGPALKFVGLIITLKIVIQCLQVLGSANIFIVFTSLSGLFGMDAPLAAISDLNQAGRILLDTSLMALMLANIVNIVGKSVFAYTTGSRDFWKKFTIGIGIVLITGLVTMLIVMS